MKIEKLLEARTRKHTGGQAVKDLGGKRRGGLYGRRGKAKKEHPNQKEMDNKLSELEKSVLAMKELPAKYRKKDLSPEEQAELKKINAVLEKHGRYIDRKGVIAGTDRHKKLSISGIYQKGKEPSEREKQKQERFSKYQEMRKKANDGEHIVDDSPYLKPLFSVKDLKKITGAENTAENIKKIKKYLTDKIDERNEKIKSYINGKVAQSKGGNKEDKAIKLHKKRRDSYINLKIAVDNQPNVEKLEKLVTNFMLSHEGLRMGSRNPEPEGYKANVVKPHVGPKEPKKKIDSKAKKGYRRHEKPVVNKRVVTNNLKDLDEK